MKAIYYTVTFLAALVVLAWAGWEVYLHRNVIVNAVQGKVIDAKKCGCNAECKCPKGKCKCNDQDSCSPDCDCTGKAPACCNPDPTGKQPPCCKPDPNNPNATKK